jgi:tetratricopeptide (TPR) repeat protein
MDRRRRLPFLGKRELATRANERAGNFEKAGNPDEAIKQYERACRLDPSWSVPFYNLGLLHKYSGDWERALVCNRRASELDPKDQAAWWNLGIAATALGRWKAARSAWRGAGVPVPDGDGPIDYPCGQTPIRLNPENGAEVVWTERLDPARAIIRSIPLPESGFRFADIVLNDGAPKGYRKLGEHDVPVFDCLGLLEASVFSTWVAEVELHALESDAGPTAIDRLIELAEKHACAAEDWSTSIASACRACDEGRPHPEHDRAASTSAGPRRVAIAARSAEQARTLLDDWKPQSGGAEVLTLDVVLPSDAS